VCQDGGAGGYEAFPDVCRLADGRLIAPHYRSISFGDDRGMTWNYEEGASSSLRARRFRITPEGVEWLTFDGAK